MGRARVAEDVGYHLSPQRRDRASTWATSRRVGWLVVAAGCFAAAVVSLQPVAPAEESFPDAVEYSEIARNLVQGDGYRPDTRAVARYPPGFPALLVPFVAVADPPDDVRYFPPIAGIVLLGLVGWIAGALGGVPAAASTWVLAALSRGVNESTTQVLSDLPASALVCAALLLTIHRHHVLAGILLGLSAAIRLGNAAFGVAAQRPRGWIGVGVALAPLAVIQLWLFGSLSGYTEGTAEFGIRWLWEQPVRGGGDVAATPNPEFYLQQLAGRDSWLVPGAGILALLELWFRRDERAARFVVMVILINLSTYFVYFYQDSRFVLTSTVLLLVFAGVACGRAMDVCVRLSRASAARQPSGDERERRNDAPLLGNQRSRWSTIRRAAKPSP